jgi:putative membrane protein
MQYKTAKILFILYLLVFTVCAINPFSRTVWWAENIPIVLIVVLLLIIFRYFKFSPVSYVLMSFLIIMHTIGGHFTFERVPFDFVNNLFGFTRNNYDRFAHFSVGFYAFPVAELILEKKLIRSKTILILFPILAIFTVAGVYEIIEWLYAISAEQSAGTAMLGSQGDVWDAQKDMLADGMGSILSMILFVFLRREDIAHLDKI